MAALVVAALAQLGDRTAWLAAILSDRYGKPGVVIAAALLALAGTYALASVGGALAAPILSPNARALFVALALLFAGASLPFAPKPPDRLDRWRLGAFGTSLLGLFIMAFGDTTQFAAAALAARSPVPWLAAVGATVGALAVVAPAALMGEAAYRRLPLTPARWIAAVVLLIAGMVFGLQALRLA